MRKKNLWIDDVRTPPVGWDWAKTSREALQMLAQNDYSNVSFDHDLGGDDTAYPVALHVEKMAYLGLTEKFEWSVHSANPVGRARIEAALSSADKYWNENSNKE